MNVIVLDKTKVIPDAIFSSIGIDNYVLDKLKAKTSFLNLYLTEIPNVAANIIKQEALSKGGEAVVSRKTLVDTKGKTDILLSLTKRQLSFFLEGIIEQPFKLKDIAKEIVLTLDNYEKEREILVIRGRKLDFNKQTYIMGILNVTPDSFSDGGEYLKPEKAVEQALKMINEGADIIDVGGESTKPGSEPVSVEVELKRVIPVIEAIRKANKKVIISIDTTKAKVAKKALESGADIVNDISGGTFDKKMLGVVVENKAPIILMHTRGKPKDMQKDIKYDNFLIDVYKELNLIITAAVDAGVKKSNIIIDPGIGFGKTFEHNLQILNNLQIFKGLGYPILIGPSRKRFLGEITGKDVKKRISANSAALAIGVYNDANILRVHDVLEVNDIVKVAKSIRGEVVYA